MFFEIVNQSNYDKIVLATHQKLYDKYIDLRKLFKIENQINLDTIIREQYYVFYINMNNKFFIKFKNDEKSKINYDLYDSEKTKIGSKQFKITTDQNNKDKYIIIK